MRQLEMGGRVDMRARGGVIHDPCPKRKRPRKARRLCKTTHDGAMTSENRSADFLAQPNGIRANNRHTIVGNACHKTWAGFPYGAAPGASGGRTSFFWRIFVMRRQDTLKLASMPAAGPSYPA